MEEILYLIFFLILLYKINVYIKIIFIKTLSKQIMLISHFKKAFQKPLKCKKIRKFLAKV